MPVIGMLCTFEQSCLYFGTLALRFRLGTGLDYHWTYCKSAMILLRLILLQQCNVATKTFNRQN